MVFLFPYYINTNRTNKQTNKHNSSFNNKDYVVFDTGSPRRSLLSVSGFEYSRIVFCVMFPVAAYSLAVATPDQNERWGWTGQGTFEMGQKFVTIKPLSKKYRWTYNIVSTISAPSVCPIGLKTRLRCMSW